MSPASDLRGREQRKGIGEEDRISNHLTERERQVLALIASGKSGKEIAHALRIAFKTVACHRRRIAEKINAFKTADLTRAAIRMGLVPVTVDSHDSQNAKLERRQER